MWLLIAFLAIPLIEITLFIQIGGAIGLGWTLAIVVVTAILGASLARSQGAIALGQLRSSFSDMRDPTEPLAHGAMILFAGALLLTPGFFTDAVGFSLLIPGVRRAAFEFLRTRIKVQSFSSHPGAGPDPRHSPRHGPMRGSDVIEGEYHEIDETDRKSGKPSGWTRH
ncbi:exlusion protein FxsA [Sulfitobacter alexandrii]|uniref:Exlusion protein FxsA n=1 Tax=Sulfitobacter alexandrii TaxID=1917485 RepID=A0A1J0WLP0_9RHOB|nr:FxsA family protein [Sulfitobacter alexandrii]APE45086.1 exlusion protein FxsA [Sulfitobacter alexandrii]